MDVKDDLGPRGGPLQVASHPDPQLVDVSVLTVIRGDGEGVWDGQQLQCGWDREEFSGSTGNTGGTGLQWPIITMLLVIESLRETPLS